MYGGGPEIKIKLPEWSIGSPLSPISAGDDPITTKPHGSGNVKMMKRENERQEVFN